MCAARVFPDVLTAVLLYAMRTYLDYAATTPVADQVREAMLPYLTAAFGNPSSLHYFGQEARRAVDRARSQVAALLNADPGEIIFTSGGTEADNLAIRGVITKKRRHVITSAVEHHAVERTLEALAPEGVETTWVRVDRHGQVDPKEVQAAIRKDTALVTIMHANNEVGTLEPIAEIARIARERGVLTHSDAVQSVVVPGLDVGQVPLDMVSITAHKFYGPKGVGALYVRKGVKLSPLIMGGGQEAGLRSGTENVPGIVGLGAACELALNSRHQWAAHFRAMRDRLWDAIRRGLPDVVLNGHPDERLPNNLHISIPGVDAQAALIALDQRGVCASAGSACAAGSVEPSHVLSAMGIEPALALCSLRLTVGKDTTLQEIDLAAASILEVAAQVREARPA